MVRIFFFKFAFALGCLCLAEPALAAGLVWEKEKQDLQSPTSGAHQVEARFSFKNDGAAAIRITGVKTSCGCVASAASKDVYAPGETGEIVATFAYGDRVGQQEKNIVVQTNDPEHPVKILTLRVLIPQIIQIEPALVFWRIGEKPDPKRMVVKVQAGVEVGELTATSSNPVIDARLEKGKEVGEYSLVVSPKETTGPQTAFIKVETVGTDPKSCIVHARIK